jgi:hypothetical protein
MGMYQLLALTLHCCGENYNCGLKWGTTASHPIVMSFGMMGPPETLALTLDKITLFISLCDYFS